MKSILYNLKFTGINILIAGYLGYKIGTKQEKEIIVTKKYKFNRFGFTKFMVIDEKGNHYNVKNSLFYWNWSSIEDWHLITLNQPIYIKYYGYRLPIVELFPSIIKSVNYIPENKSSNSVDLIEKMMLHETFRGIL